MPPRLARTARSSSRSSKRGEPAPSPNGAVGAVDLPPPAEDEFYYHEVVGFRVETTGGEPLGAVAETFTTGLNDVWVVRGSGREHLIPVIADVVRALDRATRRIVIEPLPGLLD